jgi:signal transduction histidine kinase
VAPFVLCFGAMSEAPRPPAGELDTIAELERARHAAEMASRIKSNLLRVMSHELKTPITALQLNVRVLEEEPDAQRSPRLKEGLARVARSSRRLAHLVDAALYWARAESGRCTLQIAPVSLAALVQDVRAELADYAAQKGVALSVQTMELPAMSSDRRLARLLVYLLMERAVQVTQSGEVAVVTGREEGFQWLTVSDGGPLISREEEKLLFDPLPADDLHQRSGSGSGLGLYVVSDLARAIFGDVALVPGRRGNQLKLRLRSVSPEEAPHSWRGELGHASPKSNRTSSCPPAAPGNRR